MPMTRAERVSIQKKQERRNIGIGAPLASDLQEGASALRSTTDGIIEYINYGGVLYENRFVKSLDQNKFGESMAEDGYVKFDNGLILQWGQEDSASTTEVVTFPTPFLHACLNVVATPYESGSASADDGAVAVSVLPTTTGVTFNSTADWGTIFWQAIGH